MITTNTEVLAINTNEVFISGDEVLGFMEEMYGQGHEVIDKVYEDIKWNCSVNEYSKKDLYEIKLMVYKEYMGR